MEGKLRFFKNGGAEIKLLPKTPRERALLAKLVGRCEGVTYRGLTHVAPNLSTCRTANIVSFEIQFSS